MDVLSNPELMVSLGDCWGCGGWCWAQLLLLPMPYVISWISVTYKLKISRLLKSLSVKSGLDISAVSIFSVSFPPVSCSALCSFQLCSYHPAWIFFLLLQDVILAFSESCPPWSHQQHYLIESLSLLLSSPRHPFAWYHSNPLPLVNRS